MTKKPELLLTIAILLGVSWAFVFPGPRAANDFPYVYQEELKSRFILPSTWSSSGGGMGEYAVSTLWSKPYDLLYGAGGVIGINFSILERILGILPIFLLGLFGIRRLLSYLKINDDGIFVGSLFYLLNTYIILLIDGGQFLIGLAYAWMPFAYLSVETSVGGSLSKKIKAGLAVALLGFFDIRFIYLLALLIFTRFIFRWRELLEWMKTGFVVGVTLVGLNAFWLLPAILSRAPGLPATYQRIAQTSFLSFSSLGHALTLLQPHWYLNVFGKITPLLPEFFLIPILVFLAPVLRKRDKTVAFWLLIALVSVFLAKGANPPLPQIYQWLFSHLPGFSLFRDSTKFFFLVALSYAVLIGITIDEIVKRLGKKALIVPLFLAGYFIFLTRPVWLGKMTGTFSNPPNEGQYSGLSKKLEGDKDFGRILWVPTINPLGYSSPTHPALEASRLADLRPFASMVSGTYETFNFLRAPNVQSLLDIAGVKYIVYPYPDTRRVTLKQDNIDYYHWFLDKISNSSWAHINKDLGPKDSVVPVIETNTHKDRFFVSSNIYWVVGSDGIYRDLSGNTLSSNALVFAEEKPTLSSQIPNFSGAKVILYGKNETDLAATFLDGKFFIFPAKNLDFSPDQTGWWKRETTDLISWRGFLQEKYGIDNKDFDYGGGYSIAEGNRELKINLPPTSNIQHPTILLVRAMQSSRGGRIEFYQGDKLIGNIDTLLKNPKSVLVGDKQYNGADFHWFEVGQLAINNQQLTIRVSGDINVINALAALDIQGWNRANRRINELIHQYRVFEWDKLTPSFKQELFNPQTGPNVSYERLSSTHYQVKVEGLREPAVLAFSETYDPLWQINGKQSTRLYSLINGFSIDKDGTYDVYFTAQKYVYPGLVVSGITLFLVVGGLILLKRRKDEN